MTFLKKNYDRALEKQDMRPPYGQLIISGLAINILSLALPVMTLQVYDRILPNPGSGTLPVIITGVCLAVFLEALLRLARSYTLGWSGAAYEHKLSCAAMNHILHSDLSKLKRTGIGENLNHMSAISRVKDFNNGYSFIVLFDLILVPVYLLVTVYVAGALAIVPVAVLMVFTLVTLALGQNLNIKLLDREKADDKRYNFLISTLENIHTIKALAQENHLARKYEALEEPSTRANFNVTEATSGSFNAGTVFSHIMIAAIVSVGAVLVLQGQITTGALIATILLSGRMMQPIQKAVSLWTRYQDYKIAETRLKEIFENPLHIPVPVKGAFKEIGTIETDGLSFRFAGEDKWFLKDITLNIAPGETVLLSGDYGEGKTTFLNILAGIYPPTDGEMKIDGRNVLTLAPEDHARHVGFIRTESMIFTGTIRDNVTSFGLANEGNAQELSRLLKLDRDVMMLPSGFDTRLSGHGDDGIPPGMRQRISIVRALAHKPHIILFDNADRGLDLEGYNTVYKLLSMLKGKATMVLVSDDRNICDLATRFIHLGNGKMTESAGHMMKSSTIQPYRELWA